MVQISAGPGEPPSQVTVRAALRTAEDARIRGDLARASRVCQQLIQQRGNFAAPYVIMLRICVDIGRHRDAFDIAQLLLDMGVDEPAAVETVALVLRSCHRHEAAIALLDQALDRHPAVTALREHRAMLHAETGRIAEAVTELRAVIAAQPDSLSAYRYLSRLVPLEDAEIETLERLPIPPAKQADAWYALASAYHRRGDVAAEFRYLDLANAADHRGVAWDPAAERQRTRRLIELCSADYLRERTSRLQFDRQAVFVVGMPRSGSTLVEQILASHSGTESAGECRLLDGALMFRAQQKAGGRPWPESLATLERADLEDIGRQYWADMAHIYTAAPIVIDKTLDYHRYLGLALAALPNTRVVHVLRHPMAVCLSCYQRALDYPYTHSLDFVAHRYREHRELMAHWRALFPGRILELQYEDLVTDPEPQARRLLEFCALDWDARVLEFHRSARTVITASTAQVRRPVYQSAIDDWRRFEAYLEPARRVMDA
jgi:tetratricopeptide (TPR) repeat protein